MSQTRGGRILQNLCDFLRQGVMHNLSPAMLKQSLLLNIFLLFVIIIIWSLSYIYFIFLMIIVIVIILFLRYIFVIFHEIIHDRQNHSEQHMLIVSSIFAALQLGLMCWLTYAISPGVKLLFELVAWVCSQLGTIFSCLIGAAFPVQWLRLLVISFVAVTLGVLAGNDFRFTQDSFSSMIQKWAYAGEICTAPFLCQFLTACLTTVITWFCTAAGVTLVVLMRMTAVCVGVYGALVAVSVIHSSRINVLHRSNGNSHFDDHQSNETTIQHEISVCLSAYCNQVHLETDH